MMNCGCNQNVYQIPANCSRATPNKTLLLNALAALVTGNEASTFKSELQSDCHTAESSTLSRKSCPQQCDSFFNFIASWDGAVLLIDVTLKDFWVSKFKMFILLSLADIWSGKLAEYPGSALI